MFAINASLDTIQLLLNRHFGIVLPSRHTGFIRIMLNNKHIIEISAVHVEIELEYEEHSEYEVVRMFDVSIDGSLRTYKSINHIIHALERI